MKNPFKKDNNNSTLIAFVALGAITAGAITYLYLKQRTLKKLTAQAAKDHAKDYLTRKTLKKRRTTDLHELGKIAGSNL